MDRTSPIDRPAARQDDQRCTAGVFRSVRPPAPVFRLLPDRRTGEIEIRRFQSTRGAAGPFSTAGRLAWKVLSPALEGVGEWCKDLIAVSRRGIRTASNSERLNRCALPGAG